MSKRSQDQYTRCDVSEKKKKKKIHQVLTTSLNINTSPTKISYTNPPPMSMTTLIVTWKWLDMGKGTKKWREILVIAKGKMSLSRVTESLCTSMIERMK